MSTGERIQQARKAAKLSQKELGEKLGVSASMIGQYENDLRNPKTETLFKIAEALNVHPDQLRDDHVFYFEDFMFLGSDKPDTEEKALLAAFNNLNEDGRKKALERIQELTEIQKYQARKTEFSNLLSDLPCTPEIQEKFISALARIPDEGIPLIANYIETIAEDPKAYMEKSEEDRQADAINLAKQMILLISEGHHE